MTEVVKFSIPKSVKSNEPMFKSLLDMIVVTLMAPHLSIEGAKKCGILNQSPSNCYDHIANLGKLFINGKVTLEDFLKNFNADTNISDGTLFKRTGKNIYAAKKLKNHSKGCYGIYQDILLTARRYKGINFITTFKIVNHLKRHLSKPKELVKAMKTGIIKAGEWLVIDAGLKSGRVLKQGRISGVKVVSRLASNFVVKRFGKSYRKDDILRDIKPIRRTIGDKIYTIYPFKGCLWQGTMINLFLVRAEGYDNYIPLITTSLNSKPETIIMKYEERFSIEMSIKELKSYLKIESNYFKVKESNYGYLFLLCLVYNFIQYLRLYIHDKSFKDTLDGLSAYLLSKRPPKAAALMETALKEAYVNIGYDGVNKMNDCLIETILSSS